LANSLFANAHFAEGSSAQTQVLGDVVAVLVKIGQQTSKRGKFPACNIRSVSNELLEVRIVKLNQCAGIEPRDVTQLSSKRPGWVRVYVTIDEIR
jgi:hypothetical protein